MPAANPTSTIVPETSFLNHLIRGSQASWDAYIAHPFVSQLGDGTLPMAAFRTYLIQDYIFLIHFSRAWALAAFKAETIDDIRQSTAVLHGLINEEIRLHVDYCTGFGIHEDEIASAREATNNMAYTRFVMERGLAGDLLDLLVALSPCVVGYGVIGQRLAGQIAGQDKHPYRSWIDMYSGAEYQAVCATAIAQLDRVAQARLGASPEQSPRFAQLVQDFDKSCRLEADFWQMGFAES